MWFEELKNIFLEKEKKKKKKNLHKREFPKMGFPSRTDIFPPSLLLCTSYFPPPFQVPLLLLVSPFVPFRGTWGEGVFGWLA